MSRAAAGLLLVAVLAGCSALPGDGGATPSPVGSASVSAPADALSLRDLGFSNGPGDIWLPQQVVVVERVDLENNVTLVISEPSGAELAQWLRVHLLASGYEITADGQDSLLFSKESWQGAFTVTGGHSALSLRTDRE